MHQYIHIHTYTFVPPTHTSTHTHTCIHAYIFPFLANSHKGYEVAGKEHTRIHKKNTHTYANTPYTHAHLFCKLMSMVLEFQIIFGQSRIPPTKGRLIAERLKERAKTRKNEKNGKK